MMQILWIWLGNTQTAGNLSAKYARRCSKSLKRRHTVTSSGKSAKLPDNLSKQDINESILSSGNESSFRFKKKTYCKTLCHDEYIYVRNAPSGTAYININMIRDHQMLHKALLGMDAVDHILVGPLRPLLRVNHLHQGHRRKYGGLIPTG